MSFNFDLNNLVDTRRVVITEANLQAAVHRIGDPGKAGLCASRLYEPQHIALFSTWEQKRLLAIRKFYEDPAIFVDRVYQYVHVSHNPDFVYPSKPPKFHRSCDCAALHRGYVNVEIPVEIKVRGELAIRRFREWFMRHQFEFNEAPERVTLRACGLFGLTPGKVLLNRAPNSGPVSFEDVNLEKLVDDIDRLLAEAKAFQNQSGKHRRILHKYRRYTRLLNGRLELTDNTTGCSDEEVYAVLDVFNERYKKPLAKLLRHYFRVRFNPTLEFSETLLRTLGFEPCRVCKARRGVSVNRNGSALTLG